MKQIATLGICIILLFAGGIFEIKYLNKTSLYIQSELEYIENAVKNENYEFAKSQFESTFSSWNKVKDSWNIFITHDEIDDINEYMIDLKSALDYEEEDECINAIEQLKSGIEYTIKRQNLRIDNVL